MDKQSQSTTFEKELLIEIIRAIEDPELIESLLYVVQRAYGRGD